MVLHHFRLAVLPNLDSPISPPMNILNETIQTCNKQQQQFLLIPISSIPWNHFGISGGPAKCFHSALLERLMWAMNIPWLGTPGKFTACRFGSGGNFKVYQPSGDLTVFAT